MGSEKEIITVVDKNDKVIGAVPRYKMRQENLIHRAAFILVFNAKGELFVQKRSASKDVYPGYYDIAAGGVVLDGESYEESAKRELYEELGVKEVELDFCFDFYFEGYNNRVRGRVFTCTYEGDLVLQEEEIDSGEYLDPDKCLRMSIDKPFTPDGLYVLKRILIERT